jgi:hypothetical protein
VRDFEPVFIEQGDVENFLQFIIAVVANVGVCSLGLQKTITLFPNTYRMGFNAGKIFEVFDGKSVHQRL